MNTIVAGQYSQAGIKPNNDDACNIHIPTGTQLYNKGVVAVIADGVSSCEAGAEASEACVQGFLSDYYSTPDSWTVKTSAGRIYSALNQWLLGQSQSQANSQYKREFVTTFSTLVVKASTAYIFHVGDSRIYHWRAGQLEQITNDHRVEDQSGKEYLGRAMGINHHVKVDVHQLTLNSGDGFFLCTDGICEFLADQEITETISEFSEALKEESKSDSEEFNTEFAQKITEKLVSQALEKGSDDNVTCQFLQFNQLPKLDEAEVLEQLQALPFPPDLSPGMKIDGFKILRELHASTTAQVYLALDTESDEQVVLKTPSVNYEDDPVYLDTFQHEEWIGSRLHSPHVMKFQDIRERRRFLYTVSEYIEGETLRQWMKDNPHPHLAKVRPIVQQIIHGLRAFHRMEMAHRDLKPENIMIDRYGTVKIIDFGSTRISGIEEQYSFLDQTRVQGTRNYTAPEVIKGGLGNALSDQFSLAIIVYEMLCGKLPYGDMGDSPSVKKMLSKIHSTQFTALYHHTKGIPEWISDTLQKACNPSPSHRYEALSEFYHGLTQSTSEFRINHRQPWIERDPLTFWRSLALVLTLLNAVLLILLGT